MSLIKLNCPTSRDDAFGTPPTRTKFRSGRAIEKNYLISNGVKFRPMESKDAIPTKNDRKGSRLLAVIIGLLIDIGGTLLMVFLVVFFYGIVLSMQGKTIEQIGRALSEIQTHAVASIVLYSIAIALSLFAGYICVRIVDYREYSCALFVAVISSLYGFIVGIGTYSSILNFVLSILTFTCVMLGAFIYVKLKSKRRALLE